MSLWKMIKNLLKRFWPLTIHRFNEKIEEARLEQNAAEKRWNSELQKTTTALSLAVQEQTEKTLSVYREETDSIRSVCQEQRSHIDDMFCGGIDSLLAACREQAQQISETIREELASTHRDSVELNDRLTSLQEQIERMETSVQKLSTIEGVIHRRSDRLEKCIIHCMPRAELSFEIALAEHCDLNCAGCDHFSPLAEREFPDLDEMSRDFARLSELFRHHAKEIHLLGGEPLLNPDIIEYIKMARNYFPDATIDITTNGIRLLKQPEEFWEACRENRIIIRPTKYPIPLKFEEMEALANRHGVEYHYFENTNTVVKTTNLFRWDPEGLQDGSRNFLLCHRANTCVYLQHGRLYTCSVAPTMRHFSKYFNIEMQERPEDSIDIYAASSAREIMEYLARPIPFCRYCMIEKTRWNQPWHQSERKIEEWT